MRRFITSVQAAVLACGLLSMTHTPEANAQVARTVGMFYVISHCPDKAGTYNLSNILESDNPNALGPLGKTHWWGTPRAGYYCLSQNDALLREHATLLKAAGVDYIYVDITNWHDFVYSDRSVEMITQPFENLLRVWGAMGAANTPKIIPWVKVTPETLTPPNRDMIQYIKEKMVGNPLAYMSNNKPVVFIAPYAYPKGHPREGQSEYATTKLAQYATSLLTINMWTGAFGEWKFIAPCWDLADFKNKRAIRACNQQGSADGQQISVAPAFAQNWMSYAPTAVPKFNGATFLQQMETARLSNRPYIMITGWNEWVVGRTSWPGYGDRLFTDQYNQEYNRDLEPAARSGTLYYDLLKRSVAALRNNTSVTAVAGSFGQTRGVIDGVASQRVNGWACSYGARIPVDVHLYVGGPAGVGTGIGSYPSDFASTTVADRNAVASACGSDGVAYRFSIRLPLSVRQAHQGKKIYVYAIHPTGALPNNVTSNSGVFPVPVP